MSWPLSENADWLSMTLVLARQPADAAPITLATGRGMLRIADLSWLAVASGVPLDPDWPAAALADMIRLAVARLPPCVRAALGHACAWQSETDTPATIDTALLLSLTASDGTQHSVQASLPWTELAAWLQQPDWQPLTPLRQSIEVTRLSASAWVTTALLSLSHKALRLLQPGDAIRLGLPTEIALPAWADLGHWRLHGRLTPGRLIFHHWEPPSMNHPASDIFQHDDHGSSLPVIAPAVHNDGSLRDPPGRTEPGDANSTDEQEVGGNGTEEIDGTAAVPSLDDLPVTVLVVAGHLNMKLLALRNLRPGDTVALGGEALPRVEMRAGGHLLARGELIDLNGTLAVEVTDVAHMP